MGPSGGAKPAMPVFDSLEALEEHRALGIVVSTIESLPVEELRKIAGQFLPDQNVAGASKEELARSLTKCALQLYNSHSPKLVGLEKFVDDLSRERLRTR